MPTAPAFAAILTPLPCPVVEDPTPARGCPAPGATGPERLSRARTIIKTPHGDVTGRGSPGDALLVYALAPNDFRAQQYAARPTGECALREQMYWMLNQFDTTFDANGARMLHPREPARRPPPPRIVESDDCKEQPVFRKCFPGLFRPASGLCWRAVPPRQGAARE